jgi:hypothetical protein
MVTNSLLAQVMRQHTDHVLNFSLPWTQLWTRNLWLSTFNNEKNELWVHIGLVKPTFLK